ncbi:MAG: sigma-54 dependent transcriptional regulator [Syntrophobacteraceae bacterium]|jgi:two-component system response regulator AtoC|nr:sigma-54 dependent transcriptional regulator [Syntrophobacteraceae bacterium]
MSNTILVVDDERDFLETVKRGLLISGYRHLKLLSDPVEALRLVEGGDSFDIALLDITMPGMDGIELLDRIKERSPHTECIMVTAINEVGAAVQCMQKGAVDYMVKPFLLEELILRIERVLERKRFLDLLELKSCPSPQSLNHPEAFRDICTISPSVRKLLKEAELHAASDLPVLITGESGTGKELLARAIHRASPRERFPFIAINMPASSGTLFEAEFFGHTKGAFTGAERERSGYLESAHKGTLFLDEIGNLPMAHQAKLLRVLQEGEVIKIGSSKPIKVDVRFVAATNQDLVKLQAKGEFRKDLFYRLRGAWIHLPPLRDRPDDIPVLIHRFVGALRSERRVESIAEDALRFLLTYDYPGNIRELRSIIESAANMAQGAPITMDFLPTYIQARKPEPKRSAQIHEDPPATLAEAERACILSVYEASGGNKAQTAKRLQIGLSTLRRKLDAYGVD